MVFVIIGCSIAFSFFLSSTLSYVAIRNAEKFRWGKRVYSERVRLHKKGVPRLGGLVIYISFYSTLLFFYIFKKDYFQNYQIKIIGILLASTLIAACGLYDDLIKRLSYKVKFSVQILAILVIAFIYKVTVITNPFNGTIYIGILGVPFVVLWMAMIMNAMNLIDGLDGLACGIFTIACFSFLTIEIYHGHLVHIIIIATLIGTSLAFLKYNFYPAKLFLGDSGSLFLGFMLGILALETSTKRATIVSLIVPLLALFIPVVSVIFTFSRRITAAKNPFKADRWHLHYRLLRAGISHRDTVLIYYTLTFIYAMFGTACFFMPKKFELVIIAIAGVTIWWFYMWALYFINVRRKTRK